MQRKYILIALILLIACNAAWAEDESPPYDIYLPEPYETPNPIALFSTQYLYIEAGISSASEFLLYADYMQRHMDMNAFYIIGTHAQRFCSMSLDAHFSDGAFSFAASDMIKTAQTDSMHTGVSLFHSIQYRTGGMALSYSNTIHSAMGYNETFDMFHTITWDLLGRFDLQAEAVILDLLRPDENIYRIMAVFPRICAGLSLYRILYPAFAFRHDYFEIHAGINRISPLMALSPLGLSFFSERSVSSNEYIALLSARYNAFEGNMKIRADVDSIHSYTDIPGADLIVEAGIAYTKRYDKTYIRTGPSMEYSKYFTGAMYDAVLSYGDNRAQYTAQYRIYYERGFFNILNVMFSTGTEHFRFTCGVKNLIDESNPYYQYYSPGRTYFITCAIIDGNPLY